MKIEIETILGGPDDSFKKKYEITALDGTYLGTIIQKNGTNWYSATKTIDSAAFAEFYFGKNIGSKSYAFDMAKKWIKNRKSTRFC